MPVLQTTPQPTWPGNCALGKYCLHLVRCVARMSHMVFVWGTVLPRNLKGWSWGQRKWVYKQFLQSHFREVIYCARFLTKTCLIFVALITKIVLAMMTVFVVLGVTTNSGVTCNWQNVCNGGKARGLFSLHLTLNTFNALPHSLGNIDFFTDFPSKTEIIYYIFIVCWFRYSWRLKWPFQIALSF